MPQPVNVSSLQFVRRKALVSDVQSDSVTCCTMGQGENMRSNKGRLLCSQCIAFTVCLTPQHFSLFASIRHSFPHTA